MKKDKPEIRFSSFKSMWMEQKFNDVLKSYSYRPYLKTSYENGIYPVIQQGENPILGFSNGEPFKNYRDVILFGDHTLSVYKPQMPFFVATDGVKILSARGIDGEFLTPLFEKYVPKSQGYKRHYTILKNEFISYPHEVEEQIKIGSFFKKIDETISFHQQELEALKQTKQGFLQKMFPKNGETKPEFRFKEFTENWNEEVLGNIADFSKGNGYSKGDLVTEGTPILLYGQLYTNYKSIISSVSSFVSKKEKSIVSAGNEVVVPASGESSEDIARASAITIPGIIIGGDLNIIRPANKIEPIFLALVLSNGKVQRELSKFAQGKSVVHLQNSEIKKVRLTFPKIEEQIKIGEFFKRLDEVIELKEQELEVLKQTKKGFLQKMFV